MKYRLLYMLLLLLAPQVITAQNYEYWLDSDYAGRVSKYGELGEVSFEMDVSTLYPGIHYLNCRARQKNAVSTDSYDAWGSIKRTMFYVIDTKNSEQPVRVEYWLDSDYAGRVSETTGGGAIAIEKSLSELASGIHYLNVRSLGAAGQWGSVKRTMFYVDNSVKSFANVRCWIDEDPATAVTQKVEGSTVSLSIDTSELSGGDHTLYVQGQGSDGGFGDISSFAFETDSIVNTEPEPYAVLVEDYESSDNILLTFYYDKNKNNHPEGFAVAGLDEMRQNQSFIDYLGHVKIATFDESFADYYPTSTANLFYECSSLRKISGIQNLNTDSVTNMSSMFSSCEDLTNLDLSHFNTGKVRNMSDMFVSCGNMTSLDLSGFKTDSVINMSQMFMFCSNLTNINLSGFRTNNVTEMNNMFLHCRSLKTIFVCDGWSNQAVTNSDGMFFGCTNLVGGAGTTFDAEHVDHTYAHIDGGSENPGYFTSLWSDRKLVQWRQVGGKEYRLYKANNKTDVRTNADGWNMYRTRLTLDIISGTDTTTTVVDDGSIYCEQNLFNNAMTQCMMIDVENNKMYVFANSKTDARDYSMDGYVYISSVDQPSFTKETVFTDANWGWFSYFRGIEDGQPLLSHFNYLGYYDMISKRSADGTWSTETEDSPIASPNYRENKWIETRKFTVVGDTSSDEVTLDGVTYTVRNGNNAWLTWMDNCTYVESLTIPETLTADGRTLTVNGLAPLSCYTLTRLQYLEMPSTMDMLGESVLIRCGNLKSLTVNRKDPPTLVPDNGALRQFTDIDSVNCVLRVPYGSKALYESADGWRKFQNIEEMDAPVAEPEPYAVLVENSSNEGIAETPAPNRAETAKTYTLKFYYDNKKTERNGMGVGPHYDFRAREWYDAIESITTVVFDDSFADYGNLTSTYDWFLNCSNLSKVEGISNLRTDSVTDMTGMFGGCSSLTSLDVSHFNTGKVVGMYSMFSGCSSLTTLDVSSFNTSNVTDMRYMFSNCSGLTTLDLSSFNTQNVTSMDNMFSWCSNLKTIYVSDGWTTENVTSSGGMFTGCSSLVGGMGTVYDSNYLQEAYAHIDGGPSNPGYFTNIADTAKLETVETPTFSFAYMYDSDLTIETETDDAEIYYTLNGRMLEGEDTNFGYNSLSRYSKWSVWGDNKQDAKTERSGYNGSYCLMVASKENSSFESAQAGYKFSRALTEGDYYTIRFMARSKSGNGKLQFYCQNDTLPNTRSAADTLTIGTQFADYEVTVKIDNDKTNQFVLNFGAVADTYYIDNVLFGPVISDTTNQLRTRYESPIELRQGVTIKAVAVKEGMKDSEPAVWDYFYEGWMNMLETYERCRMICDMAEGDPNVPLAMVYDVRMRLEDMLYRYYERRLEERFDDEELLSAADEMRSYASILETMMRGFFVEGVYYHAVDSTHAEVIAPLDYYTTYRNAIKVANEVHYNDLDFQVTSVAQGAFANSTLAAIVWNPTVALKYEDVAVINNPNLLVYVNEASLAPENVTNIVVNRVAKNIELVDADNCNFFCPEPFTAEAISYTREFRQETMIGVSRGWESIALPFDVQTILHEKQGVISPFSRNDNNKHFWLRRLSSNGLVAADKMEANVPYIISMPNSSEYPAEFNLPGRVTFSSANVTVPVTETRTLALADSTIMMASTMQRLGRSSSYYALNVGEVRGQYLEGSVFERDYREVRPFEAYTIHRSDTPAPRFVPIKELNGGTTGIESLTPSLSEGEGVWYDLNGRKLQQQPKQKGVYLRNGRKVIIR